MKSCRTSILLLIPVLLFGRCTKPSCLQHASTLTSTTRKVATFHRIDLHSDINLVLTQDTTEAIKVEASERLQPNILTIIKNGVLTLKNTAICNWVRDPSENVTVYVSLKKLDYLNYQSSGNVSSTNTLKTDSITFYSSIGAGNVEIDLEANYTNAVIEYESADFIFRGKSNICRSYINARGSVDFKNFEVKDMGIGYASVRNAVINVTDVLYVTMYHTGNLYYKGNPLIADAKYYSTGRVYAAK